MNNDEKIIQLLESMHSDIKDLKVGQAVSEQGQATLEQSQVLTNSRLESLEQYQSTTNSRLGTLEKSVDNLSQSQARMENNLIEHIRGLWDFHSVQTDVNNQILAALERIENKIEKHDIQIQVLDLTKSNKRKIK